MMLNSSSSPPLAMPFMLRSQPSGLLSASFVNPYDPFWRFPVGVKTAVLTGIEDNSSALLRGGETSNGGHSCGSRRRTFGPMSARVGEA